MSLIVVPDCLGLRVSRIPTLFPPLTIRSPFFSFSRVILSFPSHVSLSLISPYLLSSFLLSSSSFSHSLTLGPSASLLLTVLLLLPLSFSSSHCPSLSLLPPFTLCFFFSTLLSSIFYPLSLARLPRTHSLLLSPFCFHPPSVLHILVALV